MAQVAVDNSKALDNLKVKKVKDFNVGNSLIYGCDLTPDDTVLLTICFFNSLIGINYEGKHVLTISTSPYSSFDVTYIDDTTVAVTSGYHVISIIDISSRTVKKHIDVGYSCLGVTYRDGTLLVCAEGHDILSINLTTEEITTIVQRDPEVYSYITAYKDKLYYTNIESVTCCDMTGDAKWTFKDPAVLSEPYGITTDNKGRVYVCDRDNETVVVFSDDGKQSKIILSADDGIDESWALHFDKKRNNVLVANEDQTVFLFHVTP